MLIVTNWTALFVALTTLITAIVSLTTLWQATKTHKIVNSQRTAMMDEIKELKSYILGLEKRLPTG